MEVPRFALMDVDHAAVGMRNQRPARPQRPVEAARPKADQHERDAQLEQLHPSLRKLRATDQQDRPCGE